ncbi:MAG: exodeoxyribonuclease III [Candidatus Micrarchaeota archaeon]
MDSLTGKEAFALSLLLVSWNVNGIRAAQDKGLLKLLTEKKPDALCMQEVKATEMNLSKQLAYPPGYQVYWNAAKKPGYAGTATYMSNKLAKEMIAVTRGIGLKQFDDEVRVQTFEFDKFYLVNAYFPNSQHGLTRLDFKLEFNAALLSYLNKLQEKKPVVICGDFNVAHTELDIANPKQNEKNAGFTKEERAWMDSFIAAGYIDTFRMFTKEGGHYSWWSYRFDARSRNIGWRLDYFAVSKELKEKVKNSQILDATGSDHAPVALELQL